MSRYRLELLIALGLAIATLGAFGRACANDFVDFDDGTYITHNADLTKGLTLDGLSWAFITFRAANWHPLTWVSLLLDYRLFGLAAWGYHLTNVLLHAANGVFLFWALRIMTKQLWPSAAVAAVFALHPLRVESVAWVSERKDVLSSFFGILALVAYAYYALNRTWSRYLMVLFLFVLSLLAKPMLVTLPFLLLLLDWWPLRRFPAGVSQRPQNDQPLADGRTDQPALAWILLEKLPLVLLALASCFVTLRAQGQGHAVVSLELCPLHARVENAIVSYAEYIRMTILPIGLAAFYPHPGPDLPLLRVAFAALLLTGISVAALLFCRRLPYFIVGWFWFLGMLIPVIGVIQVGHHALADRYTYLSSVGLILIAVWGSLELGAQWKCRRLVAALVWLILLAIGTWINVGYWHDTATLWEHAKSVTTANPRAHLGLAAYYWDQGMLAKAEQEYRAIPAACPEPSARADALSSLGRLLYQTGRPEEGLRYQQEALNVSPAEAGVHINLALTLSDQKRDAQAEEHYRKAIEIDPQNVKAHAAFADFCYARGKYREALEQYLTLLAISPDNEDYENNLGNIFMGLDNPAEAINHFQAALRMNPRRTETYQGLGAALIEEGRLVEAVEYLRQGIELSPSQPNLRTTLAFALSREGKIDDAEREYRVALSLPKGLPAVMSEAWMLAADTNSRHRNGSLALRLALLLNKTTGGEAPAILDLLAAAHAENGQYPQALAIAQRARSLAEAKQPGLVKPLEQRILIYQKHRPFRLEGDFLIPIQNETDTNPKRERGQSPQGR
jgi:tetratricopeptide (TPR) repeat protein